MVSRIAWGLALGLLFLFATLQSEPWVLLAFGVVHLAAQLEFGSLLHKVPRVSSPVEIDGSLDEWAALPYVMDEPAEIEETEDKPWNGPQDASLRFGVAGDDEYLYIAVEAVDDVHYFSEERPMHQCDGLTVMVDPRPRAERTEPSADWSAYAVAKLNPAETPGGERFSPDPPPREGMKVVSVLTPRGHNTEVAIPLALIAEAQGGRARDFRLNIRLHDREDEKGNNRLWWRPNWSGGATYRDSGTFVFE